MKKGLSIALSILVILVFAAFLFTPRDAAKRGNDATDAGSSFRAPAKSERAPGIVRAGSQAKSNRIGGGNLRRIQEARRNVVVRDARESNLHSGEDAARADHTATPASQSGNPAAARSSRSPEKTSGGMTTETGLAQLVRQQRRERSEYMKERAAELASHQPGCKCAYHAGE